MAPARSWLLRLMPALLLAGVALSPGAGAHAIFVSASPSNGAVVDPAPSAVVIGYNEPIDRIHVLEVLNTSGAPVQTGQASVAPGNQSQVRVPVEGLPDGLYTVRWAVAAGDLHNVSGSFFFVVGDQLPGRQAILEQVAQIRAGEDSVALDELLPRAASLLGLALAVGLPVAAWWLTRWPSAKAAWPHPREQQLLAAGCLVAAGGLASLGLVRGQPLSAPTMLAPVLALTGAGLVSLACRPSRWTRSAAVVAGLLGGVSLSATSHSAALIQGPWGLTVDLLHVVTGGLWLSSLIGLCLLVPRSASGPGERSPASRAVLQASILAAWAAGLATAAGLWLASWHVAELTDLVQTLYGGLVGVKSLLVLAALGLAGLTRFVLYQRLGRASGQGPRHMVARSAAAEALVLVGVLLLSAGLSASATAASLSDVAGPPSTQRMSTVHFTGELDGEQVSIPVTVELTVVPARVGLNVFDVSLGHAGEPIPEVRDVAVAPRLAEKGVELPGSPLDRQGTGRFSGVGALPLEGTWDVEVSFFISDQYHARSWNATAQDLGAGGSGLADGHLVTPLRLVGGLALAGGVWLALRDARLLAKRDG